MRDLLQGIAQKELQVKKEQLNTPQEIFNFYRLSLLKAIDNCWIEEVDNLQQLRAVVFGRQYAQRNPLFEYHREAARSFRQMKEDLQTQAVKNLLLSSIVKEENGNLSVYFS